METSGRMDYFDGSSSGSSFNKQAKDLEIPLKSSRASLSQLDSSLELKSSKNGHRACGP